MPSSIGIRQAVALLLWVCAGLFTLSGCATTDSNRDSDLPWNTPQPWEGSPSIPGFDER